MVKILLNGAKGRMGAAISAAAAGAGIAAAEAKITEIKTGAAQPIMPCSPGF